MQLFRHLFSFEVKTWLRGMMVYVFLLVITVMVFAATSSDNVTIGGTAENTYLNAPYQIQLFYAVMGLLAGAMVTAFVNSAASRDFSSGMHPIIFSQPIRKMPFLMGRFWGATLIAMLPMAGVSLGALASGFNPFNEAERLGPIYWGAHLWSWPLFVIPNTILVSAFIYAIAIWTRSTTASFIGLLLLLMGYILSAQLLTDIEQEWIAALADPFAIGTFELQTKYWTAAEKNSEYVILSGFMLWNRIAWISVSLAILGIACWRFSFAERRRSGRAEISETIVPSSHPFPAVRVTDGLTSAGQQCLSQFRVDFLGMAKSTVFIVVMLFALLNTLSALLLVADEPFGLRALPVTYNVIDIVRGSLYAFLIAVITFLAGSLVWKERDAKLDEVYDALPHPTWIAYVAKLAALSVLVLVILTIGAASGMFVQAIKGYSRFQPGVYATEFFGWDFVQFFCFLVLALLVHVVSPNKYVGYFLFIVLVLANSFGWGLLEIDTKMVRFGQLPDYTYSDMFGWLPYLSSLIWFSLYWLLFAGLLMIVSVLCWQRGRELNWFNRCRTALTRWRGSFRVVSCLLMGCWLACAAWIAYNTMILNTWRSKEQANLVGVDYETKFKTQANFLQPRVTDVRYEIDIFPQTRGLTLRGTETLKNKSTEPIERLYFNTTYGFETRIDLPDAVLEEDFPDLNYRIYRLLTPLQPNGILSISYEVKTESVGFENQLSHPEVVENGTFFNNLIAPQLGYQTQRELTNKNERRRRGLSAPTMMPALDATDLASRQNTYLSNNSDWVMVESIISTALDQTAVGPGSLLDVWEKNGRKYFHYKLDHPSVNFYSFISARYKVAQRTWHDVNVEVFYHPEHEWNVDKMLRSIQQSLEYYSQNFGPYRHKQARIIEFPRTAKFAQAFPGTMPYSEGIGFIADIKTSDDIDMVYYVVAHEMAHQWWAHQVIGANMQGATILSETLAQYSALMVLEREYGRDLMRKFLEYEMDSYLKGRGNELLQEQPLIRVESGQGYIHYRKGSVVMYQLKEMIGEDNVNVALRKLIERFGYAEPPYPTAIDLVDVLREQTPADMQYLLVDLFERITLYDNRTTATSYRELPDGQFEVTLDVSCKKLEVDANQLEVETPMDDWIEIGAFASPPKGSKYGDTLHRQRVKVGPGDHQFKFTVTEPPHTAGIDPFFLLIDRMPKDNLKRTMLKN